MPRSLPHHRTLHMCASRFSWNSFAHTSVTKFSYQPRAQTNMQSSNVSTYQTLASAGPHGMCMYKVRDIILRAIDYSLAAQHPAQQQQPSTNASTSHHVNRVHVHEQCQYIPHHLRTTF